jgi:salicylate hydroxylase
MLRDVLHLVNKVLKWRLCHSEELARWTKGNLVIIGDASHPTLPYQAQGAAMAVEDGVILGHLLGRLAGNGSDSTTKTTKLDVSDALELFERLRKHRTTVNVQGAVSNRKLFHMEDGAEQEQRDEVMRSTDWITQKTTDFRWNDLDYQMDMLGFGCIADADSAFDELVKM